MVQAVMLVKIMRDLTQTLEHLEGKVSREEDWSAVHMADLLF